MGQASWREVARGVLVVQFTLDDAALELVVDETLDVGHPVVVVGERVGAFPAVEDRHVVVVCQQFLDGVATDEAGAADHQRSVHAPTTPLGEKSLRRTALQFAICHARRYRQAPGGELRFSIAPYRSIVQITLMGYRCLCQNAMNRNTSPYTTHGAADTSRRTLGGAVLTTALAPAGVAAVAAPLLTLGAVLVVAAVVLTPSVVEAVRERARAGTDESDPPTAERTPPSTGGHGAPADD